VGGGGESKDCLSIDSGTEPLGYAVVKPGGASF